MQTQDFTQAAEQSRFNAAPGITTHSIAFSGRGNEYFMVLLVNLLLTVVTLGLYTPFARRRTAQYFFGHTQVAGSPLEFTAGVRQMVFGFLLLFALYIAYNLAANTGQETVVLAFLIVGTLLAPFLWGSAMRFRLRSTRWRGVRLAFTATWGEVYKASWPVFAIALIWVGWAAAFGALHPDWDTGKKAKDMPSFAASAQAQTDAGTSASGKNPLSQKRPAQPPSQAEMDAEEGQDEVSAGTKAPKTALPDFAQITPLDYAVFAAAIIASVLCFIRLEFNYKSLLFAKARIGTQYGRWKPVYGDFVRIWLATLGVFLGCVLLVGLLTLLFIGSAQLFFNIFSGAKSMNLFKFLLYFLMAIAFVFFVLMASAPARAYREAKMFQLVWDNVGISDIARFKCNLRTKDYVLLRLQNMLFTLLSGGFYRPFAAVSEYQMKCESVTLHVKGGLDQLVGQLAREQGAVGDAVADALGLDFVG